MPTRFSKLVQLLSAATGNQETPKEIAKIIEQQNGYATARQLGKAVGLKPGAVVKRLHELEDQGMRLDGEFVPTSGLAGRKCNPWAYRLISGPKGAKR